MRKGLGKGLGALLSEYEDIYETSAQKSEEKAEREREREGAERSFVDITGAAETLTAQVAKKVEKAVEEGSALPVPINLIDPNVNQPRKNFDEEAMSELAQSIKAHGIIQPIILVKHGPRYMIIAGERRWRAAKLAGLEAVPAIIKDYSERQIKEISLVENLQREDLNPIEAARAIRQLMDEYRFTQEQVAERIGKSRSAIANTLRLLTLRAEVIDLIIKGRLSSGHAKCLAVVESPDAQLRLALSGCDNKMSVRDFEKLVNDYMNPKPAKPKPAQSLELKELISDMQRVFATKVTALGNDRRGRIYIDYYTRDDLDRIFDLVEELKKDKDNE